jgi:hypothetical protein
MVKRAKFPCEHWSASRFMLWERCPAEFYARYIAGAREPASEAMLFGSAVHRGLEAHYLGNSGEATFRQVWKASVAEELHGQADAKLTAVGLDLLERTIELGLQGVPEYAFTLPTEAWGAPTVGAVDLIDVRDGHVYDFKTTTGAWSQTRAERDIWQPALYAFAVSEALDWPERFTYVVLNKVSRQVELFDLDNLQERWAAMDEMARVIAARVVDGDFACHGKHGSCPECGVRWDHGHVCDLSATPPRIRL